MPVVMENLNAPGSELAQCGVDVYLAGALGRPVLGRQISTGAVVAGTTYLRPGNGIDSAGQWSLNLPSNDDILPEGTTWFIGRSCGCFEYESFISVPVSGGPFDALTLETDPLSEIAPSALGAHAADLLLHGGGIEIDYAEISAAVTVTGTASSAAAIPGLQIDVPNVARPIYIYGDAPMVSGTGMPAIASLGIFPLGSLNDLFALDADFGFTGITNTNGTFHPRCIARLGPSTPAGSYVLGAHGISGNFTARINASALVKARIFAIAR
jgi:hypothetical protein